MTPPHRLFWAKTDRTGKHPDWTHPLWAHIIDTASVAELLWEYMMPLNVRHSIAQTLGLREPDAARFLSFLAGAHDIGKAIPSFQAQHQASAASLSAAGLQFKQGGYRRAERIHHGHASIPTLLDWLRTQSGVADGTDLLEGVAFASGIHHGTLITRGEWASGGKLLNRDVMGVAGWEEARHALLDEVASVLEVPIPQRIDSPRRRWPSWTLLVAGWCCLSDWVASKGVSVPGLSAGDGLREYRELSKRLASAAIAGTGLDRTPALCPHDFGALFTDEQGAPRTMRPLQEVTTRIRLPEGGEPTLTIVEAPTGEGKTEAALVLALRQHGRSGGGLYVAMPSQATSNGMFRRLRTFIERAHDAAASGPANLLLVHGMSWLHPDLEAMTREITDPERSGDIHDDVSDTAESAARASAESIAWFQPKKRSLLAAYGLGTVDQALLGVLHARHFFLRLFGLAGKTIIFDEVHAYDTYMNVLFRRLLQWLRANGANVILLSATLPSSTRRDILTAWGSMTDEVDEGPAPYPAVWQCGNSLQPPMTFQVACAQAAELRWGSAEPDHVAQTSLEAAATGAAVAVIVNTVRRAQEIYRLVRDRAASTNVEVRLFHARYPFERRRAIEFDVLERFGPTRQPGVPAILIATQVAEQSLDLDFDVMFSDLAPIDLLLQRAGRLHRHRDRHKGKRPAPFGVPRLTILADGLAVGALPDITAVSGRGKVYEPAVLYRTWWCLRDRDAWSLPDEYRILIEGVYSNGTRTPPDDLSTAERDQWTESEDAWQASIVSERSQAEERHIPEPGRVRSIAERRALPALDQEEMPADTHPLYLAVTRLGGPTAQVVCLHEGPEGDFFLDADLTERLAPPEANRDRGRRLIECALGLAIPSFVPPTEYLSMLTEPRWTPYAVRLPALRNHHAMIFRNLHWYSPDGRLHYEYCPERGIISH